LCQAVAESGCLVLVISAMDKHPNEARIQFSACFFLIRLSKAHEDYRNLVLDADGLVPILRALRIHKDKANVKYQARKAIAAIRPQMTTLFDVFLVQPIYSFSAPFFCSSSCGGSACRYCKNLCHPSLFIHSLSFIPSFFTTHTTPGLQRKSMACAAQEQY
jgi:hypothetical protein